MSLWIFIRNKKKNISGQLGMNLFLSSSQHLECKPIHCKHQSHIWITDLTEHLIMQNDRWDWLLIMAAIGTDWWRHHSDWNHTSCFFFFFERGAGCKMWCVSLGARGQKNAFRICKGKSTSLQKHISRLERLDFRLEEIKTRPYLLTSEALSRLHNLFN